MRGTRTDASRSRVVGDTGQTEVTAAVLEHLASMPDLDLLLHTGDLSYADGFPPRWDSSGVSRNLCVARARARGRRGITT